MFRETTFDGRDRTADEAADFAMDEDSFRMFYDRTARGLWVYLARVTGDRALADDLLQETFFRFLRAGSRYESESHRRNALYRIATNLARDARRRSLVRAPGGFDVERAPSGGAPNGECAADLTRAMARLRPRERAMLWLAYAEGASHSEIAGVLGLRPGSMKAMLFRARRKLAVLLGREAEGGGR